MRFIPKEAIYRDHPDNLLLNHARYLLEGFPYTWNDDKRGWDIPAWFIEALRDSGLYDTSDT